MRVAGHATNAADDGLDADRVQVMGNAADSERVEEEPDVPAPVYEPRSPMTSFMISVVPP